MLKILRSIKTLSFSELMHVYAQSIAENGAILYADLDPQSQIREAEQDLFHYLATFFQTPQSYMGVWIIENRYISALRVEPYRDGMLITALETAPAYRGMGYGSQLLTAITNEYASDHTRFYSHVSKNNAASLAAHKNAGFTVLFDCARYIDGSVDHKSFTLIKKG